MCELATPQNWGQEKKPPLSLSPRHDVKMEMGGIPRVFLSPFLHLFVCLFDGQEEGGVYLITLMEVRGLVGVCSLLPSCGSQFLNQD